VLQFKSHERFWSLWSSKYAGIITCRSICRRPESDEACSSSCFVRSSVTIRRLTENDILILGSTTLFLNPYRLVESLVIYSIFNQRTNKPVILVCTKKNLNGVTWRGFVMAVNFPYELVRVKRFVLFWTSDLVALRQKSKLMFLYLLICRCIDTILQRLWVDATAKAILTWERSTVCFTTSSLRATSSTFETCPM